MLVEIEDNGGEINEQAIIEQLLIETLDKSHPVVSEGILMAAVPYSYDVTLLMALRQRDDGNDERLYERLAYLPFIEEQRHGRNLPPRYAVRPQERRTLQSQFIIRDRDGYLVAQARALAYWQNALDSDPFVQTQNVLYHQLMVDSLSSNPAKLAGISLLIDTFRVYKNDRHLAAAEKLLEMAKSANIYLKELGTVWSSELDQLLLLLRASLAQSYGHWDVSRRALARLEAEPELWPPIAPYVARVSGHNLVRIGDFAKAINQFQVALKAFQEVAATEGLGVESLARTTVAEIRLTMIALGDAYLGLARSVGDRQGAFRPTLSSGSRVLDIFSYLQALPILLYLSFFFGRQVWNRAVVVSIKDEDWIIIRLFATAVRWYVRAESFLEDNKEARSERALTDERLAFLLLEIGAAKQASDIFREILEEKMAPLSPYRRARAQVGLGEAHLQLGQASVAVAQLELAVTELDRFADEPLSPRAHRDLGEAFFTSGEMGQSVKHFSVAVHSYQDQKDLAAATAAAERLQSLTDTGKLPSNAHIEAMAAIEGLSSRQYQVRFRHPWLKQFRRIMLTLLPLVIILIPLFTINLDSSSLISPTIRFRAAPILNPDQLETAELVEVQGQAVTATNISQPPDPELLLQAGVILIAIYVIGALLLGLGTIMLTPPRTVQNLGREAGIHLDDEGISTGKKNGAEKITWLALSKVVLGDTMFMSRIMRDRSSFALLTNEDSLEVTSNTNWYRSLRRKTTQLLPEDGTCVDLDFDLWRSWTGLLYTVNILLLVLVSILVAFTPQMIWQDLPGLRYSIGDLYPYLYVGLFILPLWWGVIRRLHVRNTMKPRTHFTWWVLGAGLLLVGFQLVSGFRPLLTPLNLILPLASILLLVSAGLAVWRVEQGGQKTYPLWLRIGVLLLVLVTSLLMLLVMVRDVRAYHYRVNGDFHRDQAQLVDPEARITEFSQALNNYERSVTISKDEIPLTGMLWRSGLALGIPRPEQFTLVTAMIGQAAMQMQLDQSQEAVDTFSEVLNWTNRSGQIYAWRAQARQSLADAARTNGLENEEVSAFNEAIFDYDRAIGTRPRAEYYLWRGIAQHTMGDLDAAIESYDKAMNPINDEVIPLSAEQKTQALTAQAWLWYDGKQYREALLAFYDAKNTSPKSAEAWLGLGYAQYALEQFDDALISWEEVRRLSPKEPMVYISLGTLQWKLGFLSKKAGEKEIACEHYERSVGYFTEAADEAGQMIPQSDPERAFTYRTLGQVQYLFNPCTDHPTQALEDAVESYTKAVELEPENAFFWHMRGRLNYALWSVDPSTGANTRARLFQALDDLDVAIGLLPEDDPDIDYKPNFYKDVRVLPAAIDGTMTKGDEQFFEGNYQNAFDYYALLADNVEKNSISAFKAGLASLALGNEASAISWYEAGIERALANDEVPEIHRAWRELNDYLRISGTPPIDGVTFLFEESGIDLVDAGTLFNRALSTYEQGRQTIAQTLYGEALDRVVEDGDIEALWIGHLSFFKQSDPEFFDELNTLIVGVWPDLEALAAGDEAIKEAFRLALIALLIDDPAAAGQWFNEGIRRTETNSEFTGILRVAGRSDLRLLWQLATDLERDISRDFVSEMDAQLPMLLAQNPETEEKGLFWRYRGWFKYYIGLSVFLEGDEGFAREALDSGQSDADRAKELGSAGSFEIDSYLRESAWGWYHIERGDGSYEAGKLDAALADYEKAAEFIKPVENETAREETTKAAFLAARTAVALADFDRALFWYEEGLARALESGKEQVMISEALNDLREVLQEKPDLRDGAKPLLEMLVEAND